MRRLSCVSAWLITALAVIAIVSTGVPASAQTLEETTKFIKDHVEGKAFLAFGMQDVTQPIVCKVWMNTVSTEEVVFYTESCRVTGFRNYMQWQVKLNLRDIEKIEDVMVGTYHGVNFTCKGNSSCTAAVVDYKLWNSLPFRTLLYTGASDAERVTRAFRHLLKLSSEENQGPFGADTKAPDTKAHNESRLTELSCHRVSSNVVWTAPMVRRAFESVDAGTLSTFGKWTFRGKDGDRYCGNAKGKALEELRSECDGKLTGIKYKPQYCACSASGRGCEVVVEAQCETIHGVVEKEVCEPMGGPSSGKTWGG